MLATNLDDCPLAELTAVTSAIAISSDIVRPFMICFAMISSSIFLTFSSRGVLGLCVSHSDVCAKALRKEHSAEMLGFND
jgi:hypothetical protein